MLRFDQGSVSLSYLKVGRAGKGRTSQCLAAAGFVLPPYLVLPDPMCAPVCGCARVYACVCCVCFYVGQGREVGRIECFQGFGAVQPSAVRPTRGWSVQ